MNSESRSTRDALFEQLFLEYRQSILNYVYRLSGDRAAAEDLTQQAFVNAYRSLHRLPAGANQRAWLYRIATNGTYDWLRRRRLLRWMPLQDRDQSGSMAQGLDRDSAQHDAVERTLAQLSADDRAVLILYCVEGYATAEIAEMLGISQGAIKTRLCRARERFRRAYGEG